MKFFVVTMVHRNVPGWREHVNAHVGYLESLVARGVLRASGARTESKYPSGLLIFSAEDSGALLKLIHGDPFSQLGLIDEMTITEWNPFLGVFSAEATGDPANMANSY